jgi:hypothetical protein
MAQHFAGGGGCEKGGGGMQVACPGISPILGHLGYPAGNQIHETLPDWPLNHAWL